MMNDTVNQLSAAYDCVGIGIGPANLSLACLLDPLSTNNSCFFEQNPKFIWHEGLLLEDSTLQISILKDLVSLVNPRSEYSFLSFLHEKNRLYHFINAGFSKVRRTEFNQYFQWACSKLNNLRFSHRVESIEFDETFCIRTTQGVIRGNNIVVGVGQVPSIPECARKLNHPTIFHSSKFLNKLKNTKNKKIAVIGGGQSGAEIFLKLLNISKEDAPSSCIWLTQRSNFFPLDESSFSNEFFMPDYSHYFSNLQKKIRTSRLNEQNLLNRGISLQSIQEIYQSVYCNAFLKNDPISIKLLPGRELIQIESIEDSWKLVSKHIDSGKLEFVDADIIILATGYTYEVPQFMDPLLNRLEVENKEISLQDNFSAKWDGPANHRIYIQNNAISQKGIADPNLSLIAWRSACIVNSLMNQQIYKTENINSFITWNPHASKNEECYSSEIQENSLENLFSLSSV